GAAGDTLRIEERPVFACGNLRLETARLNRQREGTLNLIARPHAAGADDAQFRVERKVRIALVPGSRAMHRRGGLIRAIAVDAIGGRLDADDIRHLLQLAMTVRGAANTLERMIRDVQVEHTVTQLLQLRGTGPYLHPGGDSRRAGGRVALAAF